MRERERAVLTKRIIQKKKQSEYKSPGEGISFTWKSQNRDTSQLGRWIVHIDDPSQSMNNRSGAG